jgi:hypothetical protein
MKFYVPGDRCYLLDDQDVEWLEAVNLNRHKERLELGQWGNGVMFEADESIQTFVMILSGFMIPPITEQEYIQLKLDKMAYMGKERAELMRKCWFAFNPQPVR